MKKKKLKSVLQSILLPAIIIVFFLGVIVVYYFMVYSETRKNIINNCEISSVSSSSQIDKYLSNGIDTLKLVCHTLDNMIRTGNTQEEILEYMENQTVAISYVNTSIPAGVYGYIRGEYLDGSGWVPEDDYVPTERPWYIDARANVGRVAVVDPYVDAMTNKVIITFCKTLCDAKSVISMDFEIDPLQDVTSDVISSEKADIEIVLDQNYRVIAHSDSDEVGKKYIQEKNTLGRALVDKLRTNDDGFFSLNYNGSRYIVYYSNVANDWFCLSVFDSTKVFGKLLGTLIFTIIACVVVAAILLAIFISSKRKRDSFNRLNNVVGALAASIDAKDSYTNGHSGRVANYAKEIARRYGYSEKEQDEIYMMGLLHDVGKIGIPDAIINKAGKLTDEEYGVIKSHPDIGSKILAEATGNSDNADGARWHHERYDGKGYPDGLAGEKIPEKARIIAVADAYDAMTSRRSYRAALDQSVVRSEIEKGRGSQFDPKFADIMLKMIDEDKNYEMKAQQSNVC